MIQRILLILFFFSLAGCSYRCPDGSYSGSHPPRCPVNDRDLLPPANDDVGPPTPR